MTGSGSEICTFCGRPIEPGQARVGRGETAAHAACADAALADEGRWERIAGGLGEPPSAAEPGPSTTPSGAGSARAGGARTGCALSMVALSALALSALVASPWVPTEGRRASRGPDGA